MKQYSPAVLEFVWWCIDELQDGPKAIQVAFSCSENEAIRVYYQAIIKHCRIPFKVKSVKAKLAKLERETTLCSKWIF